MAEHRFVDGAPRADRRTPTPRSGSAASIPDGSLTAKSLRVSEKQEMPRRLLVVVSTDIDDGVLRDLVHRHAGDDAEMLVVAPASGISRLDWLTNDEDDARAEAGSLAVKIAEATPTDDVEGRVGDSDPLTAIEDALRTFAADEILIVAHPDDQAGWLEQGAVAAAQARFSVPVTRVTVAEDGSLVRPGS